MTPPPTPTVAPEKSCACGLAVLDAQPAREAASQNINHSLIRRFPRSFRLSHKAKCRRRSGELSKPFALNHPIQDQNRAGAGPVQAVFRLRKLFVIAECGVAQTPMKNVA
jgi:hypothetical protein